MGNDPVTSKNQIDIQSTTDFWADDIERSVLCEVFPNYVTPVVL